MFMYYYQKFVYKQHFEYKVAMYFCQKYLFLLVVNVQERCLNFRRLDIVIKQHIIVREQKLDLVGKFGHAELFDLVTYQLKLQM